MSGRGPEAGRGAAARRHLGNGDVRNPEDRRGGGGDRAGLGSSRRLAEKGRSTPSEWFCPIHLKSALCSFSGSWHLWTAFWGAARPRLLWCFQGDQVVSCAAV